MFLRIFGVFVRLCGVFVRLCGVFEGLCVSLWRLCVSLWYLVGPVANTESLLLLDVGEPCLNLNMRYHCPVYGVFNFIKPKYKCSDRTVWKYDQRDYENLSRNHVFD